MGLKPPSDRLWRKPFLGNSPSYPIDKRILDHKRLDVCLTNELLRGWLAVNLRSFKTTVRSHSNYSQKVDGCTIVDLAVKINTDASYSWGLRRLSCTSTAAWESKIVHFIWHVISLFLRGFQPSLLSCRCIRCKRICR